MTDFAAARLNMVESQVRPNGVTDRRILDAMMAVPRERFVPAAAAGDASGATWSGAAPGVCGAARAVSVPTAAAHTTMNPTIMWRRMATAPSVRRPSRAGRVP